MAAIHKPTMVNEGLAVPNAHERLNLFDGNTAMIGNYKCASGDAVLNKLGTVRFDAFPLACATRAHVGRGLGTEFVLADARLDIGKLPAGGKRDEQHTRAHL